MKLKVSEVESKLNMLKDDLIRIMRCSLAQLFINQRGSIGNEKAEFELRINELNKII